MREAKRWTESHTTALLGALGADATIESIAARTGHSVKSVRAKIARLDYGIHEIHGFTVFTVNSLADVLRVTPRQIRRWKEKGWLETKDRRITEECLGQFLRAHPDRIPFDSLRRRTRFFWLTLDFLAAKRQPSRRTSARFWRVLVGKGIPGGRSGGVPLPQWTSAAAMTTPMATMTQRSPWRRLPETNLRAAHSMPGPRCPGVQSFHGSLPFEVFVSCLSPLLK